ncbi:flavodoxin family protein [Nesterenkonia sp. E16_7]|uniref:flavodoxin family protein n=1 Tax=unclassified Nesterenkonia TaxID=2629769 RepID=UPI001C4A0BF7|nr:MULTISPECIES: flavodoxin/nitric oxide synthase [unclassified Nesterenkonia]MBO0595784.1 flavodoxin family protein [Nesterenkonia sp. E16_10]MBO0599617.1 flavodoxin family protein [Nesterenkonia sp. E16_7]
MDVVIVYESAWGNTKIIAEAVADGLAATIDVGTILEVGSAPPADTVTADLLIVGAPTHAFGLSRPQTREEAARRGGHPGDTGIREWIGAAGDIHLPVAVFDTHVRRPNLPGAASKKAAKLLRSHGASLLAKPESFYVGGYEGPVLPGEIDRATRWGAELAGRLPESIHGV